MALYEVTWVIDIDADTPREAAELALKVQRDPDSLATQFMVRVPNPFEEAQSIYLITINDDTEG
jgi:hypothetical protein